MKPTTNEIPLYALPAPIGRIAAGFPLEAVEDRDCDELNNLLAAPGRCALRVGDESMIGAGIYQNDIVILQSLQQARNGDIVAVLIDDEPLQLQRIRHLDAQRIRLYGDGAACTHRDLDAARVQVQGKVVGQLRHYP